MSAGKGMKPEAGRNLPCFRDKWNVYEAKKVYDKIIENGLLIYIIGIDLTGHWEDDRDAWVEFYKENTK